MPIRIGKFGVNTSNYDIKLKRPRVFVYIRSIVWITLLAYTLHNKYGHFTCEQHSPNIAWENERNEKKSERNRFNLLNCAEWQQQSVCIARSIETHLCVQSKREKRTGNKTKREKWKHFESPIKNSTENLNGSERMSLILGINKIALENEFR